MNAVIRFLVNKRLFRNQFCMPNIWWETENNYVYARTLSIVYQLDKEKEPNKSKHMWYLFCRLSKTWVNDLSYSPNEFLQAYKWTSTWVSLPTFSLPYQHSSSELLNISSDMHRCSTWNYVPIEVLEQPWVD